MHLKRRSEGPDEVWEKQFRGASASLARDITLLIRRLLPLLKRLASSDTACRRFRQHLEESESPYLSKRSWTRAGRRPAAAPDRAEGGAPGQEAGARGCSLGAFSDGQPAQRSGGPRGERGSPGSRGRHGPHDPGAAAPVRGEDGARAPRREEPPRDREDGAELGERRWGAGGH